MKSEDKEIDYKLEIMALFKDVGNMLSVLNQRLVMVENVLSERIKNEINH